MVFWELDLTTLLLAKRKDDFIGAEVEGLSTVPISRAKI